MQQTGIAMQHVQYKGGSQATTDLLAGTIDAHMMSSAVGAGQAENPTLKMLAVASKRRLPVRSRRCRPWRRRASRASTRPRGSACSAPPGLPDAVRERIAREVVAIAQRSGLSGEIPQHRLRAARPRCCGHRARLPRRVRALVRAGQGSAGWRRIGPARPRLMAQRLGLRSTGASVRALVGRTEAEMTTRLRARSRLRKARRLGHELPADRGAAASRRPSCGGNGRLDCSGIARSRLRRRTDCASGPGLCRGPPSTPRMRAAGTR